MSDVGDNNFVRYLYRGEDGEHIPFGATHVIVHEDATVVRRRGFEWHRNVVEVICHDKVEKIELEAFYGCISLRRVTMPGVTVVERRAFYNCRALTDVECDKLERIERLAFFGCKALRSISLSSAKVVREGVFGDCEALAAVKFSSKLERIEARAFRYCRSLERIALPMKDGMITDDNIHIFQGCDHLGHVDVDLFGEIHETIAALHLEDWRNDMNQEIDAINQILPTASAGGYFINDYGAKARVVRRWIRSVLRKIIHHQAEHRHLNFVTDTNLVDEVTAKLQLSLPHDIVANNILPFLELPSYTFEVEELGGDSDSENENEGDLEEGDEQACPIPIPRWIRSIVDILCGERVRL